MRVYALIPLILILTLYYSPTSISTSTTVSDCRTMYFFNGIVVFNSTMSDNLLLETPRNISLVDGFKQFVIHVESYNTVYNETTGSFVFGVKEGENTTSLFISMVKTCSKPYNETLSYIRLALNVPSFPVFSRDIPREIRELYLKEPHEKVVEVVVPEYEKWFKTQYNKTIDKASPLGIAVTAAYFIYRVFIEYSAGTTPRNIEEVLEKRIGDCDDMSRILVELLNYYGIPGVIVHGYVYVANFTYPVDVENVTYTFINNGPHAFAMAYIPGEGWISLDFLAGSLIQNPFIIEGYTRVTDVSEEAVEEFLDLHRRLDALQVIAIFTESDLERELDGNLSAENLLNYLRRHVDLGDRGGDELLTRTPVTTTETPIRENTEITYTNITMPDNTPVTEKPPISRDEPVSGRYYLVTLALVIVVVVMGVVYVFKRYFTSQT